MDHNIEAAALVSRAVVVLLDKYGKIVADAVKVAAFPFPPLFATMDTAGEYADRMGSSACSDWVCSHMRGWVQTSLSAIFLVFEQVDVNFTCVLSLCVLWGGGGPVDSMRDFSDGSR